MWTGRAPVRTLLGAVARLRADGLPAIAEVRLHHRVRDESAREEVRGLCAADDNVVLVEHRRLSDAELAIAVSRLDAYVLPYRHGTHSGWLEMCWDLGVPVAAPLLGHYAEQHPDGSVASFATGDDSALASALRGLFPAPTSTVPEQPSVPTSSRLDEICAARTTRQRPQPTPPCTAA